MLSLCVHLCRVVRDFLQYPLSSFPSFLLASLTRPCNLRFHCSKGGVIVYSPQVIVALFYILSWPQQYVRQFICRRSKLSPSFLISKPSTCLHNVGSILVPFRRHAERSTWRLSSQTLSKALQIQGFTSWGASYCLPLSASIATHSPPLRPGSSLAVPP